MLRLLHSYISLRGQQHFQVASYNPGFCLLCKTHILLRESIYPLKTYTITLWQMGRRLNYFNMRKGCELRIQSHYQTELQYKFLHTNESQEFLSLFKYFLFKYTGKRSGSCSIRHVVILDTFVQ